MYNQFFGLISNPFSNTPPSDNYSYLPFSHRVILQTLTNDLHKSTGLLLLIGASGIGKSTLLKALQENYDDGNGKAVLRDLAPQLLKPSNTDKILNTFSNEISVEKNINTATVFLLDGTSNLNHSFLKTLLGKVADCNLNYRPTLLILTGQPQLEAEIKALQSVLSIPLDTKSFFLKPLEKRQVKNYISHHLLSTGCPENQLFSDQAIQQITQLSKGIPRAINNICSLSILQASSNESKVIDEEIINQAAESLVIVKNTPEIKDTLISIDSDSIQTQSLGSDINEPPKQINIAPTRTPTISANDPTEELAKNKVASITINDSVHRNHFNESRVIDKETVNQTAEPLFTDENTPEIKEALIPIDSDAIQTQYLDSDINELPKQIKISPTRTPTISANTSIEELAKRKAASITVNDADKIDSQDSVLNYLFFESITLKKVLAIVPLILLIAFLGWANPQNIKPVSTPAKHRPDSIKDALRSDFIPLLTENELERSRHQEIDKIIERLNKPSNKNIAFSAFHKEFQLLHTELQIKNKENDKEHLLAKVTKSPPFQKSNVKNSQTISEASSPRLILTAQKAPIKNQFPVSYKLTPKEASETSDSDNTEFLKIFFGGAIPVDDSHQLSYEEKFITATVLDHLSILTLSKKPLIFSSQSNQKNSSAMTGVRGLGSQ